MPGRAGRPMLNSASLERIDALEVAARYELPVVVTAAGDSGMPQNTEERVTNASRWWMPRSPKASRSSGCMSIRWYFPSRWIASS